MFGVSKFFDFEKSKKRSGKGFVLARMNYRHEIIFNKLLLKSGIVFYNREHYVPLVVDVRNKVKNGVPRKDRHYAKIKGAVVRNGMLCFELDSKGLYKRHRSLLTKGFRHYKPGFDLLLEIKRNVNNNDKDVLNMLAMKYIPNYFPNGLLFDSELWGRV